MNPKTVLITGASSGIGLDLAHLFARDGYRLVLTASNADRLHQAVDGLRSQYRSEIIPIVRDLSQPGAAAAIATEVQGLGFSIDVLVNNAGTQVYGYLAEADDEQTQKMIQVNINALVQLTRLLLPDMLAQRSGRILNLGSTGSFIPGPLNAVYCATKAFVLSFSEALAAELAGSRVTVTVLCPGATRTNFANHAGIEDIRYFRYAMSSASVAEYGYRALMRGKHVAVPGLVNKLQALLFMLSRPLLAVISPRLLKGVGEYLMGRAPGSKPQATPAK